jgi:hypothetical protein
MLLQSIKEVMDIAQSGDDANNPTLTAIQNVILSTESRVNSTIQTFDDVISNSHSTMAPSLILGRESGDICHGQSIETNRSTSSGGHFSLLLGERTMAIKERLLQRRKVQESNPETAPYSNSTFPAL